MSKPVFTDQDLRAMLDVLDDMQNKLADRSKWATVWKAKAKQKREWCRFQAETISTMIVQRASEDYNYLPPNSRRLRTERDAAHAMVETHERTIAELWRALYDLASMLGVEEATVPPGSAPREVVALVQQDGTLPFEQVPVPVNPDAPADLVVVAESASTSYAPNCITCGRPMRMGKRMTYNTEHFQEWYCPAHGGYWAND